MTGKNVIIILVFILNVLFIGCVSKTDDEHEELKFDTLVWSDEFDYTGLPDSTKWKFERLDPGTFNNEEQKYVKRLNNSRVENGNLIIEAHRHESGPYNYSSARITTQYKGNWTYGRFEALIKLPGPGKGLWPAFWMMPNEHIAPWPICGEIDIMEYVTYDQGRIYGTVHTGAYNWPAGTQKGDSIYIGPDVESTFNIYAIEWYPDRIDFYVNDINYFTFNKEKDSTFQEWPFDQEFFFILNIAVGGNWGGVQGINNSIFPQQMVVDYIRVYQ
jgi:beta-glucanase (GH16 family)